MDRATRLRRHRVVHKRGSAVVEVGRGDPVEWYGFAMAERREDGAVAFAIYAQEARDDGWSAASGGLAFALLLEAELNLGGVPAIVGSWYETSDNHRQYWQARGAGLSREDAAFVTFTGAQAARHGYGRVSSVVEEAKVVRVRFERGGVGS